MATGDCAGTVLKVTSDWFPRGSPDERAEWSRQHPFRAGIGWGLLMSPLWFVMSLGLPNPGRLVLWGVLTVTGGILFGIGVRWTTRRESARS